MEILQTSTNVTPDKFREIQRVYDSIVAQPWFRDSEESRRDCSDLVMRQYRKGHIEANDLLRECTAIAAERYKQ